MSDSAVLANNTSDRGKCIDKNNINQSSPFVAFSREIYHYFLEHNTTPGK